MKINYKKILAVGLPIMFFLPVLVFAQVTVPPLIPAACTGIDPDACNFVAFAQLVYNIIGWLIGISITIAAITFTYAGAKIEDGWKMLRKTVIGIAIILGAWLIVHTIVVTLVTNNPESALRFLGGK